MKKYLKIILIIPLVMAICFLLGRYGWKLGGFRLCQSANVYDIEVSNYQVKLKGNDVNFIPKGFIGYYAEEKDNCLYIGFRFSALFGFFEKSSFEIEIKTAEKVNKIVMKSAKNETVIYDISEIIEE
ncbi:MAG: hypothetical protein ACI4WG_03605 [Erysipelotrichaceae bacterium]